MHAWLLEQQQRQQKRDKRAW